MDRSEQYRDDRFEWALSKAISNAKDHGIAFEFAVRAFDDESYLEKFDLDHSDIEDRWNVIGMVEAAYVTLTYSVRNDRIRLISARFSEPQEVDEYVRQFC
jgi:uncharacterized DUF497 family protein